VTEQLYPFDNSGGAGNAYMKASSSKIPTFDILRIARSALSASGWPLTAIAGSLVVLFGTTRAQEIPNARAAKSPMQKHYEAAFRFQNAGNFSQANSEYKLFLAIALHHMANGDANLGDYAHAAPLYDQALRLLPDDRETQMDYASAALDASDWKQAKSQAASVLDALKSNGQPPNLRAVSVLAHALLESGEHQEALEQFKSAVQLHPDIDTSSDLAAAYLVLSDKSSAEMLLKEMSKQFGDSATLHMKMGVLYGNARFFDEAIGEFRKACAKDDHLKGAHYSLGATYMMQSGEPAYDKAELEFRKEIVLDPNNSLAYMPLGRIAMSKHKYGEAETDLKHAVELNPQGAGNYLILGQLYKEIGKVAEAETSFRKAIMLTLDPSRNGYEVQQAHFWLGRLLIQRGNASEGRKEMDISQNLLYLKEQHVESRLSGSAMLQTPLEKTHEPNPEDLAAQRAFTKQAQAPIASSYDNLGVNAANAGDFANAASYFEHAEEWNPRLNNVDMNWGRAAFAVRDYTHAVPPLSRTLALHPENTDVRSMLGLSLCMTHDYTQALGVFQPIEASLEVKPLLATAYAGSLAIAGDYAQGLAQLKALERANPEASFVRYMLGEAYASTKNYGQSAEELHVALKLDPTNLDTKNSLALADLALGQKAEALLLLSESTEAGSMDAQVYFQLARLQMELGSATDAVRNLEAAVRLDPMNASFHRELAEAYRRNSQLEEAEHEARQAQNLQPRNESTHQPGGTDSETRGHSRDSSKVQAN
jgi:tetratricopeptide (TPR) repeat protein